MFEKEAKDKANEKYPIPQVWNEIHYVTNRKYAEGFQDGAEFGYNKAIDDLQKENAKLKEKLKPENCLKLLAKEGYVKFTCENGNEHDQLTKAKVALRNVIDYLGQFCSDYPDCVIEAEQFLKDSEVEK